MLLLFPGQGSQRVGMGRHLWEEHPQAEATFAEAEELLGWNLRKLCAEGPPEELTRTDKAQPAIFVTGVAAWRVLEAMGLPFELAAGHSLGEYGALVACGHLSFSDALTVVAARGKAMWRCGLEQSGTMAAIVGLDESEVASICAAVDGAWPANYNSPGQVVVSGSPDGVEQVMAKARERGAKRVLPLEVSGAFHSPLVAGAASELTAVLDEVEVKQAANARFFSTTEVRYPDASEIRGILLRQLTSPVKFTQSLRVLLGQTDAAVETGPGSVLAGLVKRIDRRFPVYSADDRESLSSINSSRETIRDEP